MAFRSKLLLLFTLVGLTATSWSTWVHYQLLNNPSVTSACDISATVSCTEAYQSAYATLGGVPVALLGVCGFAVLLAVQLSARIWHVPGPAHVPGYVFAFAVPAMALSAYLAYASWFVLRVVCLLCLSTYVAVLGLFVVSGIATRFSMTSFIERLSNDLRALRARPAASAAFILLGAGILGLLGFFPKEPALVLPETRASAAELPPPGAEVAAPAPEAVQDVMTKLQQYLDAQPRRVIPVDAGGASVVVVKFNDYQCPPCKQTYDLYKPIKVKWEKQAPGKVRFVTKDFALEGECNTNAPRGTHVLACEAAAAVRMARRNNKAEALEDWIFANQTSLTLDGLKKAVRDIGGVPDFDAQYPKVLNDVKVDTSLGGFLNVNSTPTFFINGIQLPGSIQPELLDAAIAHELKKAVK